MRQGQQPVATRRCAGSLGIELFKRQVGPRVALTEGLLEPAINRARSQYGGFDDVSVGHGRDVAGQSHASIERRLGTVPDQVGAGAGVADSALAGKQAESECCALLIPRSGNHRQTSGQSGRTGQGVGQATHHRTRRDQFAQHGGGHFKQFQQFGVPRARLQVEQVGAAGKAVVGDKAPGQQVNRPILNAQQLVRFAPDVGAVLAQPAHLDGRKNG